MRFLATVFITILLAVPALAFQAFNGTTDLKLFNTIKCDTNMTCSREHGKLVLEVTGTQGILHNRVAATATTITAAQCGSTFYNGGAVQIELPEASSALGCTLTFVTLNAANFDVNPDDADQILVQTNAAGDMVRNATLGNTITLRAVSASQWVVVGILGTWADAN